MFRLCVGYVVICRSFMCRLRRCVIYVVICRYLLLYVCKTYPTTQTTYTTHKTPQPHPKLQQPPKQPPNTTPPPTTYNVNYLKEPKITFLMFSFSLGGFVCFVVLFFLRWGGWRVGGGCRHLCTLCRLSLFTSFILHLCSYVVLSFRCVWFENIYNNDIDYTLWHIQTPQPQPPNL